MGVGFVEKGDGLEIGVDGSFYLAGCGIYIGILILCFFGHGRGVL